MLAAQTSNFNKWFEMETSDFITIDVGGTNFKTKLTTLQKFPNTRLGEIVAPYGQTFGTLLFDRNPAMFPYILDYYRLGELHLPPDMCGTIIKSEMDYWRIERDDVADCCLHILVRFENAQTKRRQIRKNLEELKLDYTDQECQGSRTKHILRKIWLLLDQPHSSKLAYIYGNVFLLMTCLSVFLFCCDTHPDFRTTVTSYEELLDGINSSDLFDGIDHNNPKHVLYATTSFSADMYRLEMCCLIFFTVELLLHFASCPVKRRFFKSAMNCFDIFLVIIIWTSVILTLKEVFSISKAWSKVYVVFKCFSIFRLFRLFRLLKQHNGFNILVLALRSSKVELLLLIIVFLMASVIFASFIYYADFDEPSTFPDVFTGIWWAIVTITTVGYGDMYPMSLAGKIVGAICTFCGVIIIALPVAIIAKNFNEFYEQNEVREKKSRTKKQLNIIGTK